jgi:hypothetical protein
MKIKRLLLVSVFPEKAEAESVSWGINISFGITA